MFWLPPPSEPATSIGPEPSCWRSIHPASEPQSTPATASTAWFPLPNDSTKLSQLDNALDECVRNGKIAPMVRLRPRLSQESVRSASAEQIKAVALRLFAERGVDGVTVREIATASGQKNHGAV